MLKILRPANFYKPNDINKILNRKIKKNVKHNQVIKPRIFK
jgi:sialic acid synthase SpsE